MNQLPPPLYDPSVREHVHPCTGHRPGLQRLLSFVVILVGVAINISTLGSEPSQELESFHFTYDIAPILAKNGCSAAECHGGATGRGGFKLSLFATDSEWDYHAIVEDLDGRRVDFSEPSESLFLKKPSRQIKHGGGKILSLSGDDFRMLTNWIGLGAPYRTGPDKSLVDLSIQRAGEDRLQVWASFEAEQGLTRKEVTAQTVLTSSNSEIVEVEEDGNYQLKKPGKAWIFARYSNQTARQRLVNPFSMENTSASSQSAFTHPLDRLWFQELQSLGLFPAGFAEDSTLLRRLYLQLVNRPPNLFEIQEYYSLPESERIVATAKKLTSTQEFADAFGSHLQSWFEIPAPEEDLRHTQDRNQRLRNHIIQLAKEERSLANVVEKLIKEYQGELLMERFQDPRDRAEFVGRGFLGIRIGCARCHNHPLDRWRQTEHLQFSAFFANPRPSESGMMMQGKFFLPGSGEPVPPQLLPISNEQPDSSSTTREQLTWFLLHASQEQLARNFANRLFSMLLGSPLVSPENDHRLTNPAVHESLMEALSELLVDLDFDFREWIHQVVSTKLYALASQSLDNESNAFHELQYLAARSTQALSPQSFKRSVESVLGVPLETALPPEAPLARQLFVLNSGMIQDALAKPGNQVDLIFEFPLPAERQLEELYQLLLSRSPKPEEQAAFLPALENSNTPIQTGRSLAFALLSSREFGFIR